jgi:hypothetical protein
LLASACAADDAVLSDAPATDPSGPDGADTTETGSLTLRANGEDFVRQGFTSVDGWDVRFDHVYVTLADAHAHRTDPPYDASTDEAPLGPAVSWDGPVTVDLAAGGPEAEPHVVATHDDVAAGLYNALVWRMVPAAGGPAQGASILLVGEATNGDELVAFSIADVANYAYACGAYVGDERKGVVVSGGATDVEATFHIDHVFGDASAPADDDLNVGAVGFAPLAALAADGRLDVTTSDLETLLAADDWARMQSALGTLGHVGEGHCYESAHGYTGHTDGE